MKIQNAKTKTKKEGYSPAFDSLFFIFCFGRSMPAIRARAMRQQRVLALGARQKGLGA